LNNRKHQYRKGKIRLVDASGPEFWQPMRKSMGSKRKQLSMETVNKIVDLFYSNTTSDFVKDLDDIDFGYSTITIDRPLRDEKGQIILSTKGKTKGMPQADSELRDTENIPLKKSIQDYFNIEVLPHAPDAWINEEKTKVGYEISFTRHFYNYQPPRALLEIDKDLKQITLEIQALLNEIAE
jgi:type I restriction enzyme M protein